MGEAPDEMKPAGTAGFTAGGERDAEQLRAEIERTREGLSETIDAIQDRLSPGNLVADAKDSIRSAASERMQSATERMKHMADTAGRVAGDLAESTRRAAGEWTGNARESAEEMVEHIRENPWPAAMAGAGLGWLLYQTLSSSRSKEEVYLYDDRDPYGYGPEDAYREPSYTAYAEHDSVFRTIRRNPIPAALLGVGIGWMVRDARRGARPEAGSEYGSEYYGEFTESSEMGAGWSGEESESDRARRLKNMAHEARERVGRVAGDAKSRASRLASTARQRLGRMASDTSSGVGRVTHQTQDRVTDMLHQNPLAFGAIALAAGVAVGLAIPASRAENRMLGSSRDALLGKAQSMKDEAVEKARTVASDVVSSASSAASGAQQGQSRPQGGGQGI
ncbi:MAG TPA: DUF3618 domain-containing protein [Vicinamibacterales bacterium]